MPSDPDNATHDPGFFDGRFMVEIEAWNWDLYVGLSHPSMPRKFRFQGGLTYNRSVVLDGRIRAPSAHRGMPIQVWLSPFSRGVRFNANKHDVGRFYSHGLGARGPAFEADLRIPEEALAPALISLGSVWKFVDIWTAKDRPESVRAFTFSAAIHPNLVDWAGPEFGPT
jgi:hypothetical protein